MATHGIPRVSTAAAKSEQSKQKELQTISEYQSLVERLQSKIRDRLYTAEVLSLTSQILLLNPEYYTVWNDRRRILINGLFPPSNGHSGPTASVPSEAPSLSGVSQTVLSLIESDLRFVIPMLRKFPKCYWIWNHRLWLLQQATQRLPVHVARDLWQAELGLVGKMLALDNRNFLCWGYRRHVVEQLESPILGIATTDTRDGKPAGMSMVEEEFHYTTKMIQSNLSNFSAWHYRSKLAPRLLAEREADANARRAFLDDEFETILSALYTDPYDQSLWFYYQWLMSNFASSISSTTVLPAEFDPSERAKRLQSELSNLRELLDIADDCKWIYEALIRYSLLLRQYEQTGQRDVAELLNWVNALRRLDPQRMGRWDDLQRSLMEER